MVTARDNLDFETIRRYALEAGIVVSTDTPAQEENARKCFGKFAALVAAHEREECIKIVDNIHEYADSVDTYYTDVYVEALRSRK